MKRTLLALTTAALMLAPTVASAHGGDMKGMAGMADMPGMHRIADLHPHATVGALTTEFHIYAPHHPLYTCPMHPDITSAKPGKDTKHANCGMSLMRQNVTIGVRVENAKKVAIAHPRIQLGVKNAYGMTETVALKGGNDQEASFYLRPGTYTITALVSLNGKKAIPFAIAYTMAK